MRFVIVVEESSSSQRCDDYDHYKYCEHADSAVSYIIEHLSIYLDIAQGAVYIPARFLNFNIGTGGKYICIK